MKLKQLVESGDPEKVAGGFGFLEGPVWHPDGFLLFSDIPASRIYQYRPGGEPAVWREPSGKSNGLALDAQGRLLACEHGNRRVTRSEPGGEPLPIAETFGGRRLNRPNDVVARSDGTVYFSDPPYGANPGTPMMTPEEIEQPVNGLYCVRPGGAVELLAGDFERPNGLAFAPGERTLYVDDSARRHVRAFDVLPDGRLGNSRVLCDMDHPQPGSPDGMKVAASGHLFVTGATGVWVFEPDGTHLGVIVTPERPANCAFGDADRQTLYITARTSLYRVRTKVPGA